MSVVLSKQKQSVGYRIDCKFENFSPALDTLIGSFVIFYSPGTCSMEEKET